MSKWNMFSCWQQRLNFKTAISGTLYDPEDDKIILVNLLRKEKIYGTKLSSCDENCFTLLQTATVFLPTVHNKTAFTGEKKKSAANFWIDVKLLFFFSVLSFVAEQRARASWTQRGQRSPRVWGESGKITLNTVLCAWVFRDFFLDSCMEKMAVCVYH